MAVNIEQNSGLPITENISLKEKIDNYLLRFSRVPTKEKLFFLQHLGIMLKAGISLSDALNTLAKQTDNKLFKKILKDIADQVEKGASFTDSLKKYEKIFGELFINMVEAGEISGKLENVLHQLYIQTKKNYELKSKVKGALTYPTVVILAMLGIGSFMIVFVVPKITAMFKELNTELPLPTKILITVSDTIVSHGLVSALIVIISIAAFVKILHTYRGKYIWQALVLKMPIVSPIIKKINIAQFARTISSLMKTDIMIVKTFVITANVLSNLHYRQALLVISEKIKKGGKISDIIASYPHLFPPVVVQMISVGEETGELDTILEELAGFYENEVDQIMNNLPSIIEPILILILGGAVGGMAIAIIMPMYSLTSAI